MKRNYALDTGRCLLNVINDNWPYAVAGAAGFFTLEVGAGSELADLLKPAQVLQSDMLLETACNILCSSTAMFGTGAVARDVQKRLFPDNHQDYGVSPHTYVRF